MNRSSTIAIGSAMALLTGSAMAETERAVAFEWSQTDPECVDAETLVHTVEQTLGRPVFHGAGRSTATVSGRIAAASSQRYEATIALRGPEGKLISQRVLTTDSDCRRLDDSIAVVVALMVDSLADEPTVLRVTEPARAQKAATNPVPGLAIGVGAGASDGLLPKVAGMVVFRGEVDIPRLPPISVSLRVHTPSTAMLANAGATFTAWDGEVAMCPTLERGLVRLGVCAGAGAGALSGNPTGAVLSGHEDGQRLLLVSLLPYGALQVDGWFWLRIELGGLFPLVREGWGFVGTAGGYDQVYRPGVVAPMAAMSLELRTGS